MLLKILTILTIVTISKCHDVIVGLDVSGKKIFDEKRVASPAIWRQTENVTINATEGEVISRVVVTDLRPEKDGDVRILEGGEGKKSVTIELKSPTVLRGFEFQIEAYSSPDQNQDTTVKDEVEHPSQVRNQRSTEQPSNTDYSVKTIAESSFKEPDEFKVTETKQNEDTLQVNTNDTSRLIPIVLNNDNNKYISTSTTDQTKTSRDSEIHNAGTTTDSTLKILSYDNNTNVSNIKDQNIDKDQSRYSRGTQDQLDENANNNNGKSSLLPTLVSRNMKSNTDTSSISTTKKNDDYSSELSTSKDPANTPFNFGLKSDSVNAQTNNDGRNESSINKDTSITHVKNVTLIQPYLKDDTEPFKNIKIDNTRPVRTTETEDKSEEHANIPKALSGFGDQKFEDPAKSIYDSTMEPEESSTIFKGLVSSLDKAESKSFGYSTELPDEKARISRDTENESKSQEDTDVPKLLTRNYEPKIIISDETTIAPEEIYKSSFDSSTDIPRNARQVEKDSLKIISNNNSRNQKSDTQDDTFTSPPVFNANETPEISTSTLITEIKNTEADDAPTTNNDLKVFPKSITAESSIPQYAQTSVVS